MRTEPQIQIPKVLFINLSKYFLLDQKSPELEENISRNLNAKLDRIVEHELYTKSKTAPTDAEKEKARQEYLDKKGIPESFRW